MIFAYILHKHGVPDDSAAELLAAARTIDASAPVTAVVTGNGAELDCVCDSLRASFPETWKIGDNALSYPNAEVVRRALVNVLPRGGIVLVPHSHFGVDLSPGLSIKMQSAYVPDVVSIEGISDGSLNLVRQEFGGLISTHVRCNLAAGAVLNIRPGAFKAIESVPAAGIVVDKSAEAGDLTVRRRYVKTVKSRRISRSSKNWRKRWERRSVVRDRLSTRSGWKSRAR
jgi:electron transfer flavoprotein alpha subunit